MTRPTPDTFADLSGKEFRQLAAEIAAVLNDVSNFCPVYPRSILTRILALMKADNRYIEEGQ